MLNDKYVTISLETIRTNLQLILTRSIPVWRRNRRGEFVIIPLERLEQFLGDNDRTDIDFYITDEWKDLVRIDDSRDRINALIEENRRAGSGSDYYLEKRGEIKKMTPVERDREYLSVLSTLQRIDGQEKVLTGDMIENLIEAVSNAYVLNKSSFEENLDGDESISADHIKTMAKNTTALVQSIMGIFKNTRATNDFINKLGEKSTGSTIDHMNSVFLNFLPFCFFYNSYFTMGKIAKIRSDYKKKYFRYYRKLIPDNPPESLEDVFAGGMRELDMEKLLQFSIGAFLHDIGKIDNIDYFEGESKYDRKIIMKHAPISYNMIVKTREFDSEVAFLAALHHEYYNDSSGYGLSKMLFPESLKKFKVPQYCLSYDISDMKSGRALAYVPAKILEIIDVFDALTDRTRRYREKEFTVDEALEKMKTEFIDKALKLDPILFTVFIDYVSNHTIFKDGELIQRITLK